jgi:hypothetical protein
MDQNHTLAFAEDQVDKVLFVCVLCGAPLAFVKEGNGSPNPTVIEVAPYLAPPANFMDWMDSCETPAED